MRKPHAKSRLKTLPADRQADLFEYLKSHTLAEGVQWLAASGVDTQDSSLSEWYSWYPDWLALNQRLTAASTMGEDVADILRALPLNLDEQKLSQASQAIFEADALRAGDSELFVALRKLRQEDVKAAQKQAQIAQKDKEITLAVDKFQFEAATAVMAHLAELRTIAADRALSGPEKVKAVQLKLFGTPRTALEVAP